MTSTAAELGNLLMDRRLQTMRYRGVVDASPLPAFVCEPSGECAYVNGAYLDLVGAKLDEVLGRGWKKFIHPDDIAWVATSWDHAVSEQEIFSQRVRYVNAVTGQVTRTTVQSAMLPCKGQVGYCMPTSWSNSQLPDIPTGDEVFFENAPDLLAIADDMGYYVKLNKAWETVLGYDRKELMTRPFGYFVHPDDRLATQTEMVQLQTNPTIAFQNRYRAADDSFQLLSWRATRYASGLTYAIARHLGPCPTNPLPQL